MNTFRPLLKPLCAVVFSSLLLTGCSSGPKRPDGADAARNKLTRLQSDPELASRAPVAIKEAEMAVRAAEEPQRDRELARHLVLIADRKVDTAWERAQGRLLEDQRTSLSEERERARLEARTREADKAKRDADLARSQASAARMDREAAMSDAEVARSQAEAARLEREAAQQQAMTAQQQADAARMDQQAARSDADIARSQAEAARMDQQAARSDADIARSQAEAARMDQERTAAQAQAARRDADASKQQSVELQRQIAELNARETERGLIVTLGDVLFETGKSDLKGGATNNLAKLAAFLNEYPDRSISIEGHTDSVGDSNYNLRLSQQRAESVKTFLETHGVAAARVSASGKGEATPVSSNDSTTGRQQNRRVEVIIANPATASR